jgi:uncharacterized protein YndB with AHSA1/START domain
MRADSLLILVLFGLAIHAYASETLTAEPGSDSYHFVSHYSVEIDAPVEEVWKHLVDLGSWMYEFEMAHVSGSPGRAGQVLRLYEGQEFLVQVIDVVPEELLVIANLPSNFRGERSTGTGVMTLHWNGSATTVSLTMSRRYEAEEPDSPGFDEQRAVRESVEFRSATRAMWQDRFLARLRSLAESD